MQPGTARKPGGGELRGTPGGELGRDLVPPAGAARAALDRAHRVEAERQQHRLLQPLVDLPAAVDLLGDPEPPDVEPVQGGLDRLPDLAAGAGVDPAALLEGVLDRALERCPVHGSAPPEDQPRRAAAASGYRSPPSCQPPCPSTAGGAGRCLGPVVSLDTRHGRCFLTRRRGVRRPAARLPRRARPPGRPARVERRPRAPGTPCGRAVGHRARPDAAPAAPGDHPRGRAPARALPCRGACRSCRRAATPGWSAPACPTAPAAWSCLSLARLNRVRAVDPLDDTITVEAGCVLETVQQAAAEVNRLFPLALGAQGSCQIGGNLSSNAGGVNVLRYGMARALVLGLEVVLADGRVWDGLRALAQGQHRLRPEAALHRRRGHARRDHRGRAPAARHARASAQTAWLAVPSPAAAVALLALFRERLGETVSSFELMAGGAVDAGAALPAGRALAARAAGALVRAGRGRLVARRGPRRRSSSGCSRTRWRAAWSPTA